MWSSLTETLIAKGSSQNLFCGCVHKDIKPLHDFVLGATPWKELGIPMDFKSQEDNHQWYHPASDSFKPPANASTFRMQKAKYSSAKEPISTQYANKRETPMLGTIKKQISSHLSKTNASISVPIVKEVTAALINELPLDSILDGWKN